MFAPRQPAAVGPLVCVHHRTGEDVEVPRAGLAQALSHSALAARLDCGDNAPIDLSDVAAVTAKVLLATAHGRLPPSISPTERPALWCDIERLDLRHVPPQLDRTQQGWAGVQAMPVRIRLANRCSEHDGTFAAALAGLLAFVDAQPRLSEAQCLALAKGFWPHALVRRDPAAADRLRQTLLETCLVGGYVEAASAMASRDSPFRNGLFALRDRRDARGLVAALVGNGTLRVSNLHWVTLCHAAVADDAGAALGHLLTADAHVGDAFQALLVPLCVQAASSAGSASAPYLLQVANQRGALTVTIRRVLAALPAALARAAAVGHEPPGTGAALSLAIERLEDAVKCCAQLMAPAAHEGLRRAVAVEVALVRPAAAAPAGPDMVRVRLGPQSDVSVPRAGLQQALRGSAFGARLAAAEGEGRVDLADLAGVTAQVVVALAWGRLPPPADEASRDVLWRNIEQYALRHLPPQLDRIGQGWPSAAALRVRLAFLANTPPSDDSFAAAQADLLGYIDRQPRLSQKHCVVLADALAVGAPLRSRHVELAAHLRRQVLAACLVGGYADAATALCLGDPTSGAELLALRSRRDARDLIAPLVGEGTLQVDRATWLSLCHAAVHDNRGASLGHLLGADAHLRGDAASLFGDFGVRALASWSGTTASAPYVLRAAYQRGCLQTAVRNMATRLGGELPDASMSSGADADPDDVRALGVERISAALAVCARLTSAEAFAAMQDVIEGAIGARS